MELPARFSGCPPINPKDREAGELKTWKGAQGLAADVQYYGEILGRLAEEQIGHLYPKAQLPPEKGGGEATVIGYFWAKTIESPDPSWSGHVPLVKSWVVRKPKPGKPVIWIEPLVDLDTQTISYRIREGGEPPKPSVSRGVGRCIATKATIDNDYIVEQSNKGKISYQMMAVVCDNSGKKQYLVQETPPMLSDVDEEKIPRITLPKKALGFTVYRYGLRNWSDLFNPRQQTALSIFSASLDEIGDEIAQVHDSNPSEEGQPRSKKNGYSSSILTYLAIAISKCVDGWSKKCRWRGEAIANTYSRQDISYGWDYVEANPFSDLTASWTRILGRFTESIASLDLPRESHVYIVQEDARNRVSNVHPYVLCTDPPYYDNIGYANISDFFYGWLKMNIGHLWPDLFSTIKTPKSDEMIAEPARHNGKEEAKKFFEQGMFEVFRRVRSNIDPGYPATIFYAYRQTESETDGGTSTGWETFLQGLNDSKLQITATWPLRTEMKGRVRALGSNTLATSVVIACRPRPEDAPLATRKEFVAQLEAKLPEAIRLMKQENIAPVDLAQAAIGPGMEVFSSYRKVLEADGTELRVRDALAVINEALESTVSQEETEFDADTRWALTWYTQHGLDEAPYGDAETLARAKNTSMSGVEGSGIVYSGGGKVRLRKREEMDPDWSSISDRRLTIWEITQHMIIKLSKTELETAKIIRNVGGGVAERARQLAYLLFQIADRNQWTEEAFQYDTLVRAWPHLAQQASHPDQREIGI